MRLGCPADPAVLAACVWYMAAPEEKKIGGGGMWWMAVHHRPADLLFGDAQVKMVTADDDKVTDITLEGDAEEVDRMVRQLGLQEKGKVYVKGLLES